MIFDIETAGQKWPPVAGRGLRTRLLTHIAAEDLYNNMLRAFTPSRALAGVDYI